MGAPESPLPVPPNPESVLAVLSAYQTLNVSDPSPSSTNIAFSALGGIVCMHLKTDLISGNAVKNYMLLLIFG